MDADRSRLRTVALHGDAQLGRRLPLDRRGRPRGVRHHLARLDHREEADGGRIETVRRSGRGFRIGLLFAAGAIGLLGAAPAEAYIGPGAGFAFLSSFFVLFVTFLLAIATILIWPIRLLVKTLTRKKNLARTDVDRVIIVGYDGVEPKLVRRWMDEGKLPHFKRLAEMGDFQNLDSSWPSMSPVAWSTFATSTDASKHNQYDFLNRDPKTYLPDLASVKITNPTRSIRIGKYRIPLGKPVVRLMQKSVPFWKILGEHGV
ncbi:MAG: hypothetical protein EHM19_00620, partial [Candidatus Latescibacterota bacterium]